MNEVEKHFCWECGVNEIPELEYCCEGMSMGVVYCGCFEKPLDPPYCDDCLDVLKKEAKS